MAGGDTQEILRELKGVVGEELKVLSTMNALSIRRN